MPKRAAGGAQNTNGKNKRQKPTDEPQRDESTKPKPSAKGAAAAQRTARQAAEAKSGASVDRNCFAKLPGRERVHVLTEGTTSWSAMLNQTNLAQNNNKFYVIQLLQSDTGSYFVYFRWGRVGKVGLDQLHPCGSDLSKAKSLFESKFRDKTYNEFANRAHFAKVAGKYDLIDVQPDEEDVVDVDQKPSTSGSNAAASESEATTRPKRRASVKSQSNAANSSNTAVKTEVASSSASASAIESKLDLRVQHFLDDIFDRRLIEQTVRELDYDTERLPLGRLTQAQIRAGYTALSQVEQLVQAGKFGSALTNACSNFYTKIPHAFGMRRPPLISNRMEIKTKVELLETLETACVAVRLDNEVKADDASKKSVLHPLDAHLERLECSVRVVEPHEAAFGLIKRYVSNTQGPTHSLYTLDVLECFEVSRGVELAATSYRESLGGRTLLWHGTRRSNLAGILKAGLLIAPPEAPVTGWMFDKGVYFADCVSKSANYCHASAERNEHFVLLCEVALGHPTYLVEADYNVRRNLNPQSVLGVGSWTPDPRNTVRVRVPSARDTDFSSLVREQLGEALASVGESESQDAQLVSVPCGQLVSAVSLSENTLVKDRVKGRGLTRYVLNYNEFVVYDVRQIRMRYVVKVRFNFK